MFDSSINPKELNPLCLTTAEAVDYSKIVTPDLQVLAVGEKCHILQGARNEITQCASLLKSLGLTCAGLEFVSIDRQQVMDKFLSSPEEDESNFLDLADTFVFDPTAAINFFDLLKTLKNSSYKIFGVEMADKKRRGFKNPDDLLKARDILMAECVLEALNKGLSDRVLLFTGSYHSLDNEGTVVRLLKENGVNVTSLVYVGMSMQYRAINQAITYAGFQDKRFMMRTNKSVIEYLNGYCDWIIHLPQDEVCSEQLAKYILAGPLMTKYYKFKYKLFTRLLHRFPSY